MALCPVCCLWETAKHPLCTNCHHMMHQLPRAEQFTCLTCGSHHGVAVGPMGRCMECGQRGVLRVSAKSARRREVDRDTDVWEPPPQLPRRKTTAKKKRKPTPKKPPEPKSVWDWLKKPAL